MENLFLRPYGYFEEDLNINFNREPNPYLITRILHCCTRDKNYEKPSQTFFWELTISKRIEALLKIVYAKNGDDLAVQFGCSNAKCRQPLEITFSIEELCSLQHKTNEGHHQNIRLNTYNLKIRLPTGRDQLTWLKHTFPDEDTAIRSLIGTLITNTDPLEVNIAERLTEEEIEMINESMEEFDPLVYFHVLSTCPYCGNEDSYEFNLEEIALSKLYKTQLTLYQIIHRLAVSYNWSESQILAIPPWRRSYYLAQIEKEFIR
jgi:hypothetical protein